MPAHLQILLSTPLKSATVSSAIYSQREAILQRAVGWQVWALFLGQPQLHIIQEAVVEEVPRLAVDQGQSHLPRSVRVTDVKQVFGHFTVDTPDALIHLAHLLKFVNCFCVRIKNVTLLCGFLKWNWLVRRGARFSAGYARIREPCANQRFKPLIQFNTNKCTSGNEEVLSVTRFL